MKSSMEFILYAILLSVGAFTVSGDDIGHLPEVIEIRSQLEEACGCEVPYRVMVSTVPSFSVFSAPGSMLGMASGAMPIGQCNPITGTITIQRGYMEEAEPDQIKNLLLHEFGHCMGRWAHTEDAPIMLDGCPGSIMAVGVLTICYKWHSEYYIDELVRGL